MEKNLISVILVLGMLFSAASWGDRETPPAPVSTVEAGTPLPLETEESPKPEETGGKTLVACFSATGHTLALARYAAEFLEADFYEIKPREPYTQADLAYYTDCRADREQEDDTARPGVEGSVEDMDQYSVVFLGYPIWHGRPPRILYTFLESYDWVGKTVIPFCTSGGSPYNDSGIRDLVGEDAAWITGRRFPAGAGREEVTSWLETLELEGEESPVYLTVNGSTLPVVLEENSSAQALLELLADAPLTISMEDYNRMEKVGPLGRELPRNDERITTAAGDLILYQGNSLALYYRQNTWNFTRLGRVDGVTEEELREILGQGEVTVTLSLER